MSLLAVVHVAQYDSIVKDRWIKGDLMDKASFCFSGFAVGLNNSRADNRIKNTTLVGL